MTTYADLAAAERQTHSLRCALAYLAGWYRDAGSVPTEAVHLLSRISDPTGIDRHLLEAGGDPLPALRAFATNQTRKGATP